MKIKKVKPGTEVVLMGEHRSEWVDCDDKSCELPIHREFPTGETVEEEIEVEVASLDGGEPVTETQHIIRPVLVRRHKYAERTAIAAVVVGEEPAPSVVVSVDWKDLPDVVDEEGARAYANEHNVPVQRRIADGMWVWGDATTVTPPWAKPKLLLLVKPEGGGTTTVSAEYADVETV